MSKLYVVVQVSPKRRYDYKNGWIREETSVGVPYVLSDYEEAHKRAKEKQDARVPAFVKEFPFNPLDDEISKLKSENDQLRALVRKMHGWMERSIYDGSMRRWEFEEIEGQMAKLGFTEVDA